MKREDTSDRGASFVLGGLSVVRVLIRFRITLCTVCVWCVGRETVTAWKSIRNTHECVVVAQLLVGLQQRGRVQQQWRHLACPRIVVLTFYAAQRDALRSTLQQHGVDTTATHVHTVDSFQGVGVRGRCVGSASARSEARK